MSVESIAAWLERHPVAVDTALVLLLAPFVLLGTVAVGGDRLGWPFGLLWGLVMIVPLCWRRSRPQLAATGVVIGHVVQVFLSPPHEPLVLPHIMLVPVVLYGTAAFLPPRKGRWWLTFGLACAAFAAFWFTPDVRQDHVLVRGAAHALTFGAFGSVVLASWFMGRITQVRREQRDAVTERAAALEREQAEVAGRVAAEERVRIARDMHDIVAHSLAVIVVQADGGSYAARTAGDAQARLATAAGALDTIGVTAREALAETRRLVGALREGEAPDVTSAPTLERIDDLVREMSAAQVPVELRVSGRADAHPTLSQGAQLAAYRVVQEALTNVLKHAGAGARASVELVHDAAGLRIEVSDDGAGEDPSAGPGGHGLIGMRERVAALGGTFEAAGRPGGGYTVRATIPAEAKEAR